jgi:AcrR family transcriptional regulator
MVRQSTRRPRSSLSVAEILDAAEAVASAATRDGASGADGLDTVTMRAVAQSIDASPMALYRYFATKNDLVAALLDRVLGRVPAIPETDDWSEDLRAFARAHEEVLAHHPWAIAGLFRNPDPGPGAAVTGEQVFRILARGGLTGERAVAAFSAIIALNYGWSAFHSPDSSPAQIEAGMLALPPDAFPHTRAVAGPLARYADQANYDRALDLVIAGIRADARRAG